MDQPTDGRMDKASYRDAWTHLKSRLIPSSKKYIFYFSRVASFASVSRFSKKIKSWYNSSHEPFKREQTRTIYSGYLAAIDIII